MKLISIGRGLIPLTHFRQTFGRSRSEQLRPSTPGSSRVVRPKVPGAGRKMGLSSAGLRLFRVIARGTQPGHPRGLFLAWPGWEHVADRLWPTMEIPKAPYGLLRMRIKPYKGKPLTLPDGVRIGENVLVGELHCDNQAFLHIVFVHHINPYRACREDLHSLAMWARKDSLGGQVEAIFGRTMLAVGGARLGFSVRDVPKSLWLWLERFFMTGLLLLYTEGGLDRLTRGTTVLSYPKEIWMSRDQLVKQYGDRDGRRLDLNRESKPAAENFARLPSSEFGLDLTEREES